MMAMSSNATTWTTASLSDTAVQAAANSASNGDTIDVIAGVSPTWFVGVYVDGKKLYFKGHGKDSTIIRDSVRTQYRVGIAFLFNQLSTTPCRLSNLRIVAAYPCSTSSGAVQFKGSTSSGNAGKCMGWRMDRVAIDSCSIGRIVTTTGLNGSGRFYGVIDHCDFYARFNKSMQGISVFGSADSAFNQTLSLGTDSATYVEDCNFFYSYTNDGALDAFAGSRYVMRYNTIYNTPIGHHGYDSQVRSTFSYEVYGNTFISDNGLTNYMFKTRGGTGVVYDNTGTGAGLTGGIGFICYRSCECPSCPDSQTNCTGYDLACCSKGRCDGRWAFDGNDSANGYPCRDQVGRSTDLPGGKQTFAPAYNWNNIQNGVAVSMVAFDPWHCTNPSMSDHIKEGRDYYNGTAMPGYTPLVYPHPVVTEQDGGTPPAVSACTVSVANANGWEFESNSENGGTGETVKIKITKRPFGKFPKLATATRAQVVPSFIGIDTLQLVIKASLTESLDTVAIDSSYSRYGEGK